MRDENVRGITLSLLVVCSAVVAGAAVTGTAAAGHGAENGNYTVNLPFDSDHYPRDKNPGGPYNASINHYSAGTQESWSAAGAPDGIEQLEYIVVGSKEIDFSECTSSNTAAFGIDRDNDDSGTNTDISLLNYMEASHFNDNSIVVDFYEGDELGAPSQQDKGGKEEGREDGDNNAELYPDDEIVSHQGYKSAGGPCYGMPKQPGWYQMQGKANGTTWSGDKVELEPPSHYFYICVCDSEEEAYATLGPPPGQDNPYEAGDQSGSSASTPASESTDTPTPALTPESTTPTPDSVETATSTPEPADTPTPDQATEKPRRATQTVTDAPDRDADGGGSSDGSGGSATAMSRQTQGPAESALPETDVPTTPTLAEGPGFGVVLSLLGVAGAALLALRRE